MLKSDSGQIIYMDNPSGNLQMQAVESDCGSIIFIEHPTEKVQIRAVTADPELFIYIGSPTERSGMRRSAHVRTISCIYPDHLKSYR